MKSKTSKGTKKTRPRKRTRRSNLPEITQSKSWREMRLQPAMADGPRDPAQPLWVPEGIDLSYVPVEVRQAVAEVIQPVYEQYVVGADDGLEKSLGLTLTHLLWLEVLEQFDLKREYTQVQAVLGITGNREQLMARHLRLIDSKVRVGYS